MVMIDYLHGSVRRLSAALCGLLLLVGWQAAAQPASRGAEALAQITENPDRAATNMHSYEFHPLVDTPAPKGFKPFYVSHYGRHGSRYETSASFAKSLLTSLHKADSLSLLTDTGQALYRDVQAISDEHIGMDGMLTPRGGQEHQKLAARMAERYSSVFKQKGRKEVLAVSSTSQRCIVSMANFTSSLKGKVPDLEMTITTGQRYMAYINPPIRYAGNPFASRGQAAPDNFDWTRFMTQVFRDTVAAETLLGSASSFAGSVFSAGCVCQTIDFMGVDIFRNYFTPEELTHLWEQRNDMIYGLWGNSLETGDAVRAAPVPLLKDFVEKADAALAAGSHRCADLRFGHDTTSLPLAALLGIDDPQGRRFAINEAHNYWFAQDQVPMATNIQMIFYRNRKGEVLTKVLFNEKEVRFSGMKTEEGPYYRWEALRSWFLSLCE